MTQTGVELIVAERERQIADEGWTAEHDDQHAYFELTKAAECYAKTARGHHSGLRTMCGAPPMWPWDESWWKASPDPIRNLVKAGALIAAEIDRLQRLGGNDGRTIPAGR